jgi:hypothetical protein
VKPATTFLDESGIEQEQLVHVHQIEAMLDDFQ